MIDSFTGPVLIIIVANLIGLVPATWGTYPKMDTAFGEQEERKR